MQIVYHGLGCFSLKGKDATVITDPFDPAATGVKLRKITGDILTLSRSNGEGGLSTASVSGDTTAPVVVDWPGEYEYRRVSIIGTQSWQNKKDQEGGEKGNTIFTYYIDEMHICHLGALGHALTMEQIDEIGDVDILLVPVGGIGSFDIDKVKEVVERIEPRVIIPMYYHIPGAKEKLEPVEAFVKALGETGEKLESLKITKRDLPSEESSRLVVLEV